MNGVIDCQLGTDEGCPFDYFVCDDATKCIEMMYFMDGVQHCNDGSDERSDLQKLDFGEPVDLLDVAEG
ncbi:unnamed protein product [Soboliphyme baturini]|uniref:Chitin-binding type-2 domain-containing protein n=1 Tax=Soboliphyme baturini TaxID=241478 RepID=A0A183J8B0_9BILA|nr:unnamed protein product [Soboliphyme baturini]